ncbi:sodium:calcium antiporter [Candidatus Pacearchaeota archaeon]|nr:sodium:calcium antiporter [Candidatus Pacearchaeota archaeon]
MVVENIIYFAVSALFMIIAGIFLVKSLVHISRFLGISEFSAAFIIMAFATSIPEFFIGVTSALSGNPSLSLGNVIGANILDLTLIMGIIVLSVKEIKIKSDGISKDLYFMLIAITLVVLLFSIGRELSRIDGIILLVVFFFHTVNVFRKRKKFEKQKIKKTKNFKNKLNKFYWLLIFLIALIGLFVSSNFVVKYAVNLAEDLKLPQIFVGLFLISIATTLPELVFGLSAVNLKHKVMAVGDQVGTVVMNSTFILGTVALIKPITAEFLPFIISGIFMFVAAFIFTTFVLTGKKIEKNEAISLILIYVLFIIFEIFVK